MRRVLIIGSGGAGKSTLAETLTKRLQLPLVRLDALYWRAGWIPTPKEEWVEVVAEIASRDAWVMDGNYSGTIDLRLTRCDTVIFLDLPRVVCLWRIVKRRLRYHGRARPDLAPGCPERLSWEFIEWVWTYPTLRRRAMLEKLRGLAPEKRVLVLTSRRAVADFIAGIPLA